MVHRKLVLLIEDDGDTLFSVSELLREAGFDVDAVPAAESALAILARRRPDAVITDIVLPATDGYALVRAIKAGPETKHIPVVGLSGLRSAKERALDAGCDAFLHKPADIVSIVRVLTDVMGVPVS